MKIVLHNKDIIHVTEADTIVLPVDGNGPGMEGNIARRFMRHLEMEEMWELYSPTPKYPFNGQCHWSPIDDFSDDTHFQFICALGVLSHQQSVNHKALMKSALHDMFSSSDLSGDLGFKFACPVLSGGWRNNPAEALYTMLNVAEQFRHQRFELHIAERDKDKYETFRAIVR